MLGPPLYKIELLTYAKSTKNYITNSSIGIQSLTKHHVSITMSVKPIIIIGYQSDPFQSPSLLLDKRTTVQYSKKMKIPFQFI